MPLLPFRAFVTCYSMKFTFALPLLLLLYTDKFTVMIKVFTKMKIAVV